MCAGTSVRRRHRHLASRRARVVSPLPRRTGGFRGPPAHRDPPVRSPLSVMRISSDCEMAKTGQLYQEGWAIPPFDHAAVSESMSTAAAVVSQLTASQILHLRSMHVTLVATQQRISDNSGRRSSNAATECRRPSAIASQHVSRAKPALSRESRVRWNAAGARSAPVPTEPAVSTNARPAEDGYRSAGRPAVRCDERLEENGILLQVLPQTIVRVCRGVGQRR